MRNKKRIKEFLKPDKKKIGIILLLSVLNILIFLPITPILEICRVDEKINHDCLDKQIENFFRNLSIPESVAFLYIILLTSPLTFPFSLIYIYFVSCLIVWLLKKRNDWKPNFKKMELISSLEPNLENIGLTLLTIPFLLVISVIFGWNNIKLLFVSILGLIYLMCYFYQPFKKNYYGVYYLIILLFLFGIFYSIVLLNDFISLCFSVYVMSSMLLWLWNNKTKKSKFKTKK